MAIIQVPLRNSAATYINDEERDSLLSELAGRSANFISDIGYGLDTPGAFVRTALHNHLTGGNRSVFDDERVSGRDLLRQAGLVGPENTWGNAILGFGTEMLLDPLAWTTGPTAAFTRGGRVVKAAGLTDDVARVASQRLSDAAAAGNQFIPDYAARTMRGMGVPNPGVDDLSNYAEHFGRPLVGKRAALQEMTLGDIAAHSPDFTRRIADSYADIHRTAAPDPANLLGHIPADVLSEPLGRHFGLAIPGQASNAGAFNVPVIGDALSHAMDYVGSGMRWSAPGRLAASLLDKQVSGQTDALNQAIMKKVNAYGDRGEASALREYLDRVGYDATANSPGGMHDVQTNEALARLIEQPRDPNSPIQIATPADYALAASNPEVARVARDLPDLLEDFRQRKQDMGAPAAEMEHPYGLGYLPYKDNQPAMQKSGGAMQVFDPRTPDSLRRSEYDKVPLGQSQLREFSSDPQLAGRNRTLMMPENLVMANPRMVPASDDYIANIIHDRVNNSFNSYRGPAPALPEYSRDNALELTRMLHRMPEARPIFGMHPLESGAQYAQDAGRKIGQIDALLDSVAGQVRQGTYGSIPGGDMVSVPEALRTRLKLEDGALDTLANRLTQRYGYTVTPADLANMSLSKEVVDQLGRVSDSYRSPQAQAGILNYVKAFNNFFKANALMTVSRNVRDLYSSSIGNFLLAGHHSIPAMADATALLNGSRDNYEAFGRTLAVLPRYSRLPEADRLKQFMLDAGQNKILGGMGTLGTDIGDRTGEALRNMLPGSNPEDIIQPASRMSDMFAIRGVYDPLTGGVGDNALTTRNPLYKGAEVIADKTDSWIRLQGYLGLLRKGTSPEEAARLVKAQQVDYSTLTPLEKTLRDYIIPFYSYESRSMSRIAGELVKRPGGRTGQMLRGLNRISDKSEEGEDYVPKSIRAQPPFFSLGDGSFLHNMDFPGIPSLNRIKIQRNADGSVNLLESIKDTGMSYVSSTSPTIKHTLQTLFDRDAFTGRPLRDTQTNLDWMMQRATGDPQAQAPELANALLGYLPNMPTLGIPKVVNELYPTGRNANTELPFATRAGRAALKFATGLTISTPTAEQRDYDAAREASDALDPYKKTFSKAVIPEDVLLTLPPDVQRVYQLQRRLDKDRRDRQKLDKLRQVGGR